MKHINRTLKYHPKCAGSLQLHFEATPISMNNNPLLPSVSMTGISKSTIHRYYNVSITF